MVLWKMFALETFRLGRNVCEMWMRKRFWKKMHQKQFAGRHSYAVGFYDCVWSWVHSRRLFFFFLFLFSFFFPPAVKRCNFVCSEASQASPLIDWFPKFPTATTPTLWDGAWTRAIKQFVFKATGRENCCGSKRAKVSDPSRLAGKGEFLTAVRLRIQPFDLLFHTRKQTLALSFSLCSVW